MLRKRHDLRTIAYLVITVGLFFYQWRYDGLFNPWLYPLTLFLSLSTAIISHNQNHVSMWRSRPLNLLTNYVIGIFYGHPAIGWVPTHNLNHHKLNNRDGDLSICPRWFKGNHLLSLLIYPTITSLAQTKAIREYISGLRTRNRRLYWEAVSEYVVFFGLMAVAFLVDWKKALFLLLIPQQVALFTIQSINFFQHVECDKTSEWNHSRNFTGPLVNALLFNNGFHTVHHEKPGVHWSELPNLHAQHAPKIGLECIEPSWPRWFARIYLVRPFRRLRPA